MPSLDDLAAFAHLIEVGSFTAAAEGLGCSKGQLSKRISSLEQQLGTRLLHRTTRRLHLTAAGQALLPEAQALARQGQLALQRIAEVQDQPSGTLRLSVPVSLGETFFDGLLLEFCRQYPGIRIELDLFNGYRDLLRDGFDLAIRSGRNLDERLVARPLFSMEEITCATPTYLAQHGEPADPQALASHNCLLNSHYSGYEEWLYHRQHDVERIRVSGHLASNHYSLLKKAALNHAGIARLPSYMPASGAGRRKSWSGCYATYRTQQTPVFLVHPWQGRLPRRGRGAGGLPAQLVPPQPGAAQRAGAGETPLSVFCATFCTPRQPWPVHNYPKLMHRLAHSCCV